MLILVLICTICKSIIFKKQGIKVIKAFIPCINKYELGMIANTKKLAIANAILGLVFWPYFMVCLGYEIWIMQNYTSNIRMSETTQSLVEVIVPENIANIAVYSKYALIILAIIIMICWCMMMWKYTMYQHKNPWWIVAWAIAPAIAYIYFAFTTTFVDKNGKKYHMKKVEVS